MCFFLSVFVSLSPSLSHCLVLSGLTLRNHTHTHTNTKRVAHVSHILGPLPPRLPSAVRPLAKVVHHPVPVLFLVPSERRRRRRGGHPGQRHPRGATVAAAGGSSGSGDGEGGRRVDRTLEGVQPPLQAVLEADKVSKGTSQSTASTAFPVNWKFSCLIKSAASASCLTTI